MVLIRAANAWTKQSVAGPFAGSHRCSLDQLAKTSATGSEPHTIHLISQIRRFEWALNRYFKPLFLQSGAELIDDSLVINNTGHEPENAFDDRRGSLVQRAKDTRERYCWELYTDNIVLCWRSGWDT